MIGIPSSFLRHYSYKKKEKISTTKLSVYLWLLLMNVPNQNKAITGCALLALSQAVDLDQQLVPPIVHTNKSSPAYCSDFTSRCEPGPWPWVSGVRVKEMIPLSQIPLEICIGCCSRQIRIIYFNILHWTDKTTDRVMTRPILYNLCYMPVVSCFLDVQLQFSESQSLPLPPGLQ